MATNYTPIAFEAPGDSATVNAPLEQLDTALGNMPGVPTTNKNAAGAIAELHAGLRGVQGGSTVSGNQLIAWAEAGAYQLNDIVYDGTYTSVISTADALWPDGSTGTFTATTINSTWQAIDAYTITHATSSQTVTQAAVTRNSDGNITQKPNLSVS